MKFKIYAPFAIALLMMFAILSPVKAVDMGARTEDLILRFYGNV